MMTGRRMKTTVRLVSMSRWAMHAFEIASHPIGIADLPPHVEFS